MTKSIATLTGNVPTSDHACKPRFLLTSWNLKLLMWSDIADSWVSIFVVLPAEPIWVYWESTHTINPNAKPPDIGDFYPGFNGRRPPGPTNRACSASRVTNNRMAYSSDVMHIVHIVWPQLIFRNDNVPLHRLILSHVVHPHGGIKV